MSQPKPMSGKIFAKNCMKIKEIRPRETGLDQIDVKQIPNKIAFHKQEVKALPPV